MKAGAALLIGAAVRGDRRDQKTPRALRCSAGPEWPTHRGRAGNAARASALCGLAQARARGKRRAREQQQVMHSCMRERCTEGSFAEASREARQLQRGLALVPPRTQAARLGREEHGLGAPHAYTVLRLHFGEGRKWKQLRAGMSSSRGNATGACIGGSGVSKQLAGFATWASCEGYKETRRNRLDLMLEK